MTDTTETSNVFNITFRDKAHFDEVVKWLNQNIGHGKENWTMEGRVLRHLKRGKEVTRKVIVRNKDFDPSGALYLALI